MTRMISLAVLPQGEPLYSERVTTVSIDDEAGGEFIVLSQSPDSGEMRLAIDPDEWPHVVAAVERLLATIEGVKA